MPWNEAVADGIATRPPPSESQQDAPLSRTVLAGLQLALLGKPSLAHLRYPIGLFWLALGVDAGIAAAMSALAVEPPRRFEPYGVATVGLHALVGLAVIYVLARSLRREDLFWPLAVLSTWAQLVVTGVSAGVGDHLLPTLGGRFPQLAFWTYVGTVVTWWIAILHRAAFLLAPGAARTPPRLVLLVAVPLSVALPWGVPPMRLIDHDYSEEAEGWADPSSGAHNLIAEEVFMRQPDLLARALRAVNASARSPAPQLFFVAFAPYGDQRVFLREAQYGADLMAARFGAAGHTLVLANSPSTVEELPLASLSNLEAALRSMAQRMNLEQDILFLFLTSHGSRDATLSLRLGGLSFRPLDAPSLAAALKAAGIRWKVVLVSGCYSGSFIPALADDDTLLITAAAADRTSFGCSDGAQFTYFGRAYFERALNRTESPLEAFEQARRQVTAWERQEGRAHSRPQMAYGAPIRDQLERWRLTLRPGLPLTLPAPHRPVLDGIEALYTPPSETPARPYNMRPPLQ